ALKSPPLTIDVVPLPSPAPRGFDPASVGQCRVDAAVDRTTIPAGEPVTLTFVVRGTGAIRRQSVPVVAVDGFEVTPPHDFDERVDKGGDKVGGERRYRYLLQPRRGG